jgi:hypothetical protein
VDERLVISCKTLEDLKYVSRKIYKSSVFSFYNEKIVFRVSKEFVNDYRVNLCQSEQLFGLGSL